jgi:hypothetical protein
MERTTVAPTTTMAPTTTTLATTTTRGRRGGRGGRNLDDEVDIDILDGSEQNYVFAYLVMNNTQLKTAVSGIYLSRCPVAIQMSGPHSGYISVIISFCIQWVI